MKVKIGVSARHVHLCKEDLAYLFGDDYELIPFRPLTQIGEYASSALVTLEGPKGSIANVRILGPVRDYTQIEISKTDAYNLGVNPPVRDSGDILESAAITIVNGDKKLYKEDGCIIANRHIHINQDDALVCGLSQGQVVKVQLPGEKGGILYNVHVKVKENYNLEIHLDLDDANAHLIKNGDEGEIINE
jgi:propanediol utilization protein